MIKKVQKAIILMLFSTSAYAMDCSVPNPSFEIPLASININPSAAIGDVVAKSEQISKVITCQNSPGTLWAYIPVSDSMHKTDVSISEHPITNSVNGSQNCPAVTTGYPGLGVVWYNYNSRTKAWQCVTSNIGVNRTLNHGSTTEVKDEILLVKTGPIQSGNFNFDSTFYFDEGWYTSSYLPDGTSPEFRGRLYEIKLKGQTEISSPICTVKKQSGPNTESFNIEQALSGTYISGVAGFRLSCEGYIEDGSIVRLKFETGYDIYPYDSNYFSTSEKGVALQIYFSENKDGKGEVISPEKPYFDVLVNQKISDFYIYHSPFIKTDSETNPVNNDINYGYKISIYSS